MENKQSHRLVGIIPKSFIKDSNFVHRTRSLTLTYTPKNDNDAPPRVNVSCPPHQARLALQELARHRTSLVQCIFEPWEDLIPAAQRCLVICLRAGTLSEEDIDTMPRILLERHGFPVEVRPSLLPHNDRIFYLYTRQDNADTLAYGMAGSAWSSLVSLVYYKGGVPIGLPVRRVGIVGVPAPDRLAATEQEGWVPEATRVSHNMVIPKQVGDLEPKILPPGIIAAVVSVVATAPALVFKKPDPVMKPKGKGKERPLETYVKKDVIPPTTTTTPSSSWVRLLLLQKPEEQPLEELLHQLQQYLGHEHRLCPTRINEKQYFHLFVRPQDARFVAELFYPTYPLERPAWMPIAHVTYYPTGAVSTFQPNQIADPGEPVTNEEVEQATQRLEQEPARAAQVPTHELTRDALETILSQLNMPHLEIPLSTPEKCCGCQQLWPIFKATPCGHVTHCYSCHARYKATVAGNTCPYVNCRQWVKWILADVMAAATPGPPETVETLEYDILQETVRSDLAELGIPVDRAWLSKRVPPLFCLWCQEMSATVRSQACGHTVLCTPCARRYQDTPLRDICPLATCLRRTITWRDSRDAVFFQEQSVSSSTPPPPLPDSAQVQEHQRRQRCLLAHGIRMPARAMTDDDPSSTFLCLKCDFELPCSQSMPCDHAALCGTCLKRYKADANVNFFCPKYDCVRDVTGFEEWGHEELHSSTGSQQQQPSIVDAMDIDTPRPAMVLDMGEEGEDDGSDFDFDVTPERPEEDEDVIEEVDYF